MEGHDDAAILRAFHDVVNMPAAELRKWLTSESSRSVGMTAGGQRVTGRGDGDSVGHHMGERILDLLGAKAAKLSGDDYAAMRKVVGYVHRHLAQRPKGDVTESRWRYSLMNWGHDPLQD